MLESKKTKLLLGVFDEEDQVVSATKAVRQRDIPIFDIFSPYAVHGLDEIMGIQRSRLPYVCFAAGAFGCIFALLFQFWVFRIDWPIIVGGKPFNAVPAFIPVVFEMTVLLGGIATALAFFVRSKLSPRMKTSVVAPYITDNRFVMAFEIKDASIDVEVLAGFLKKNGATDVKETYLNS